MKLIDKDALIAEIERLLAFYLKEMEDNKEDPWAMDIAKRDILQEILSFLETLEVKEVDLEKEYEKFVVDDPIFGNFITNDTMGMKLAKHFFELGLKHRKYDRI